MFFSLSMLHHHLPPYCLYKHISRDVKFKQRCVDPFTNIIFYFFLFAFSTSYIPPSYCYTFISFFPPHCIAIENEKKTMGENLKCKNFKINFYFWIKGWVTSLVWILQFPGITHSSEKRRKWEHSKNCNNNFLLIHIFKKVSEPRSDDLILHAIKN